MAIAETRRVWILISDILAFGYSEDISLFVALSRVIGVASTRRTTPTTSASQ